MNNVDSKINQVIKLKTDSFNTLIEDSQINSKSYEDIISQSKNRNLNIQ